MSYTITPEERAAMRSFAEYADKNKKHLSSAHVAGIKKELRLLNALEAAEADNAQLRAERDWLAERLAERCEELQCVGSGGNDPCYTGKGECETAENFSFTRCWAACSRIKNERL